MAEDIPINLSEEIIDRSACEGVTLPTLSTTSELALALGSHGIGLSLDEGNLLAGVSALGLVKRSFLGTTLRPAHRPSRRQSLKAGNLPIGIKERDGRALINTANANAYITVDPNSLVRSKESELGRVNKSFWLGVMGSSSCVLDGDNLGGTREFTKYEARLMFTGVTVSSLAVVGVAASSLNLPEGAALMLGTGTAAYYGTRSIARMAMEKTFEVEYDLAKVGELAAEFPVYDTLSVPIATS